MFEWFRKRSKYKDNGIRLLLLTNVLEKENKRVRVSNYQLKAKCELRGPSQEPMKGQSSPASRKHKTNQCQDLLPWETEHRKV